MDISVSHLLAPGLLLIFVLIATWLVVNRYLARRKVRQEEENRRLDQWLFEEELREIEARVLAEFEEAENRPYDWQRDGL